MTGPLVALELAGHVVMLLWGMRTVQRGIERVFGSDLRRVVGRALRNRLVAFGAGAGVTMLLQSSTATAMMVTSFAARGAVDLVPAMAVMLGANVGTALIVKALSFDVSWLSPLLMVAGYLAQRRFPKGRYRELGRVGIGLGLMLLALHLMVETLQPSSAAVPDAMMTALLNDRPAHDFLTSLTADPVIDLLVTVVVTFAAHSSIAVVLLLASVAGGGDVLSPVAAAACVLGANVGGALPPVVETSGSIPANRRLPLGNLLIRAAGCAVALPLLGPITALIARFDPGARSAVITFHLGFNVALAAVAIGLLGPLRDALAVLLPEKVKAGVQPLFLDEDAQETPYLALSNAAREMLRMGDLVDALLHLLHTALTKPSPATADRARVFGKELDGAHDAVKRYLAGLERSALTERDAVRLSDLIEFAVNLGRAGDILQRRVAHACARDAVALSEADREAALALHARVAVDLKLALSTMMTEDDRSARELLDAKRALNEAERVATREHLAALSATDPAAIAASSVFLAVLRDLKMVNSHLASIGYAVLPPVDRSDTRTAREPV